MNKCLMSVEDTFDKLRLDCLLDLFKEDKIVILPLGGDLLTSKNYYRNHKKEIISLLNKEKGYAYEDFNEIIEVIDTDGCFISSKNILLSFIFVMTDPTMGCVSASLAMLGDINVAEPNALIGFAGPRVIEQTVREKLPEGFQRAEFLVEKGAIDMIIPRAKMRDELADLVALLLGSADPNVQLIGVSRSTKTHNTVVNSSGVASTASSVSKTGNRVQI